VGPRAVLDTVVKRKIPSPRHVLRIMFGPKREEVVGGLRRLHTEELHNFYASQNIIRVIKGNECVIGGEVVHMGEIRNAYKIMGGKS
jgi:hypothetical protein